MATTASLTGVTVQDQSDAATGGTQIGNLAVALERFVVPRFSTTAARDTAYSNAVTAGAVMADGMMCTANGVPYRRIAGVWQVDRPRIFQRAVTGLGTGYTIASGGSAETGITTGIGMTPTGTSFNVNESSTYAMTAAMRVGPNPANTAVAAQCTLKVDGSAIGNVGVSRLDQTISISATIVLASGAHTVTLRVDAVGGAVTWVDGIVTIVEGTAE